MLYIVGSLAGSPGFCAPAVSGRARASNAWASLMFTGILRLRSVSYTHLDVYKRQVHVVPKVGKIGDTRFQQAGVQAEPGTVFSQCSIRQIVTS